ncbi:hypothetical protein [Streptomyces sp. NPDC096152]|uniref:hypothetical protein n=1 Tax=Streptomyces sp. NPDC096152 TaxID=3366078 RepID=UPI0038095586
MGSLFDWGKRNQASAAPAPPLRPPVPAAPPAATGKTALMTQVSHECTDVIDQLSKAAELTRGCTSYATEALISVADTFGPQSIFYSLGMAFRAATQITHEYCERSVALAREILPELNSDRLNQLLRSFAETSQRITDVSREAAAMSKRYYDQYQIEVAAERQEYMAQMSACFAEMVRGEYTNSALLYKSCAEGVLALRSTVVEWGF